MRDFLEKGVTGFVLHPRIGIPESLAYLSDRFMELVLHAVDFAARNGMRVLLYDEAMYPSGSAHGLVVKADTGFASMGLRMEETRLPCGPGHRLIPVLLKDHEELVSVLAVQHTEKNKGIHEEKTQVLQVMDGQVSFSVPETGTWSMLTCKAVPSGGTIRGIHFGEDDGEPCAPPSADLLNPQAVRTFLSLTHERYAQWLRPYSGTTVIGFFTDEPSILGRNAAPDLLPWTKNFLPDWNREGLLETDLPLLHYEAGTHEQVRTRYNKVVNHRLVEVYYMPLSQWCENKGLVLAGHPEGSMDIGLLRYFGMPGQDLVWRWVGPEGEKALDGPHSTMAKSAADAARHEGRRHNANECFGCCGPEGVPWAFSADDMKWMLDWLFVRGVNQIIPHAFYYSVEGPGRYGERPPDVGPNNIWWPEYRHIALYIRRMSWLLTDSREQARVAVLCQEDWVPWRIVAPLYRHQIGVHYLEASRLLSKSCITADGCLEVGAQSYRVVLVEEPGRWSAELPASLRVFTASGVGHVLPGCPYGRNGKGRKPVLSADE